MGLYRGVENNTMQRLFGQKHKRTLFQVAGMRLADLQSENPVPVNIRPPFPRRLLAEPSYKLGQRH